MKIGVSPLERAFQLARSGTIVDVSEIKAVLNREGYESRDLHGPALIKQLRDAIKAARESASAARS